MHIDPDSYLISETPLPEHPEHRLWYAVLLEAIKDKDLMWLHTTDYEGSFEYICKWLHMDQDRVREAIIKAWATSSVNLTTLSPGKWESFASLTPERRLAIAEGRKRLKNKMETSFQCKPKEQASVCQLSLGL